MLPDYIASGMKVLSHTWTSTRQTKASPGSQWCTLEKKEKKQEKS